MKQNNDYLRDADYESNKGVSNTPSDLAVRLNPKDAQKADPLVKSILRDETTTSLSELVKDEAQLLMSLDEYAINLVIHSVAKTIDINSPECEDLFKHDSLILLYQDSELNTPLHYLADRGLDLFGKVPTRWLLTRNKKGATVVHILAKRKELAEKVLALPPSILALRTKNGISIQDTAVNIKSGDDIDLLTLQQAMNQATARSPSTEYNPTKTLLTRLKAAGDALASSSASSKFTMPTDDIVNLKSMALRTNDVVKSLRGDVTKLKSNVDIDGKPLIKFFCENTQSWREIVTSIMHETTIDTLLFFSMHQFCAGIFHHVFDDSSIVVSIPREGQHISSNMDRELSSFYEKYESKAGVVLLDKVSSIMRGMFKTTGVITLISGHQYTGFVAASSDAVLAYIKEVDAVVSEFLSYASNS